MKGIKDRDYITDEYLEDFARRVVKVLAKSNMEQRLYFHHYIKSRFCDECGADIRHVDFHECD